ncbi:MAG: hypothetical protein PVG32_13040 [Anaerolineales bacterium]
MTQPTSGYSALRAEANLSMDPQKTQLTKVVFVSAAPIAAQFYHS